MSYLIYVGVPHLGEEAEGGRGVWIVNWELDMSLKHQNQGYSHYRDWLYLCYISVIEPLGLSLKVEGIQATQGQVGLAVIKPWKNTLCVQTKELSIHLQPHPFCFNRTVLMRCYKCWRWFGVTFIFQFAGSQLKYFKPTLCKHNVTGWSDEAQWFLIILN